MDQKEPAMVMEKKKDGSISGRFIKERRAGIDRRVLTYDWYIPERRSTADRRQRQPNADSNHGEWRDRRRYA